MDKIISLQPFMHFHTIPLGGESIKRTADGKKTPVTYPPNWQQHYQTHRNDADSKLGGLLLRPSNLIAIDCDSTETYNLFRTLDPDYQAYFDSIGKLDADGQPIKSCTILYSYTEEAPSTFKAKNLDFYSQTGMVFLPTAQNETKTTWYTENQKLYNQHKEEVILKAPPAEVLYVLNAMNNTTASIQQTEQPQTGTGFLAPILDQYDLKGYHKEITAILTPKAYRTAKFRQQKHLHPNDIEGSGHGYLFKVFCILAGDLTVDQPLAQKVIEYINNLWDNPMPLTDLYKNIINNIVSGTQKNPQGQPYWQYDPDYEPSLIIHTPRKEMVEVFYDDKKEVFFFYNLSDHTISEKSKRTDATTNCKNLSIGKFSAEDIDNAKMIRTLLKPTEEFGHINDDHFNLFHKTEAMQILTGEKKPTDYQVPTAFMQYMDSFIPNPDSRKFMLRYLRTKLTTFKYSPLALYLIGIQGSGKGILASVLGNIVGAERVVGDLQGNTLLENHNGWLEGALFVVVNELSDELTTAKQIREATGKLKQYTGSEYFMSRQMHKTARKAEQTASFIVTSNRSPLNLGEDKRRFVYMATPNILSECPYAKMVGMTTMHREIMEQTNDIAYYLATEFENLDGDEYTTKPNTENENKVMFESLPPSKKIVYALKNLMLDELYEYLDDNNALDLFKEASSGRVFLSDIVESLNKIVTLDNTETVIVSAMKQEGFTQSRASHKGDKNAKYYPISGIERKEVDNGTQPQIRH